MVTGPALYVGRLRHRRRWPRAHAFTYGLFMVLLDIDHIEEQMAISPLASVNRFNWASYDDRDHLGDPSLPLRERLRRDAEQQGVALPDGPIYLLTHLRYLGYNFNPISLYYCFSAAGSLELILAEVNSTFGEQRAYWLPLATGVRTGQGYRLRTPKTMHVSPFMKMDMDYEFVLTPPAESLVAHMNTFDRERPDALPDFDATLTLERRPWTRGHLHRALLRHPWMTAKVTAAIHWQALRLWLKGVPPHAHPVPKRDRTRARKEARV